MQTYCYGYGLINVPGIAFLSILSYNFAMIQTILLLLLTFYMVAGFALALSYLRHRSLKRAEFALWGMLALLVPVFGPFFVIAARPGPRKRPSRPRKRGG